MPYKPKPATSSESLTLKSSLWAYHFPISDRSVVSLSSTTSFLVLHSLLFMCFVHPSPNPQIYSGYTQSTINPLLVKLPKSRITAHLHSFVPLFFPPTFGTNFHILFNLILPSKPSGQLVTTTSDNPPSKTMIFSVPLNHPQTHFLPNF